jgi:hypothetical protein
MSDGRTFRDIDDFRRFLVEQKEQIARGLVQKLVTYATGGAPEAADRSEVEAILSRIRPKGYPLRSLIHEVVQSRMFRDK